MSATFAKRLKGGLLAFSAFVLVLFATGIVLHISFGLLVAVSFGVSDFLQFLKLFPPFLVLALEYLTKCAFCNLCILSVATYFGVRTAFTSWFSWIEAGVAGLVIPALVVLIVGRNLYSGFSILVLTATVPSVLLCRFLLLKAGTLSRSAATP